MATGSRSPDAAAASTRASLSRWRPKARKARTTPMRPCTTSGSARAKRSSAAGARTEKTRAMGKTRWVRCTHTHMDHSPAAAATKKATGAKLYGRPAPAGQDATFVPDQVLSHGDRVQLGSLSLKAVHTPGHA